MLLCFYAKMYLHLNVKGKDMGTRITADLENQILIKLLKHEAQDTGTSMKNILIRALEVYFYNKIETNALAHLSQSVFSEWNDKRDSDYDKL